MTTTTIWYSLHVCVFCQIAFYVLCSFVLFLKSGQPHFAHKRMNKYVYMQQLY